MAQAKPTPPPPPQAPDAEHEAGRYETNREARKTVAPGTQAFIKERGDQRRRDLRIRDEIAYRQATEGCRDQETADAVLALGGDVSRSSPVREQVLPGAEPGLTTRTGAYRTPIDPTTAAVPADEDSDLARNIRGTPTLGSAGPGEPERRWNTEDPRFAHLRDLPTREERESKEREWAANDYRYDQEPEKE
jgi:hypothetical protein